MDLRWILPQLFPFRPAALAKGEKFIRVEAPYPLPPPPNNVGTYGHRDVRSFRNPNERTEKSVLLAVH